MSPSKKCRILAVAGAITGGVLDFFSPPFIDLIVLMGVQLAVAAGIALVLHKHVGLKRLLPLVAGWTLTGAVLGFVIKLGIPLFGLFLAPVFALGWTYMLGEVSIWRASFQK